MGKKRIIAKSEAELIKEVEDTETTQKKAVSHAEAKPKSKKTDKGCVYIQSTYNNTLVTVADDRGNVLAWASAASVGFKGPKKATPYAASKVIDTLMEKIHKIGIREVSVFVRGVGSGRESAVRALAAHGLEINLIKDMTPVPHNGCRPPKVRRV